MLDEDRVIGIDFGCRECDADGCRLCGDGNVLTSQIFGGLGIAGEAGRFETETASLIVLRVRGSAFVTPDVYADAAATPWLRGTDIARRDRVVDRVRDQVLIDDRVRGTVDGRPVVLRQFTAVLGRTGMALQFRYIDPPDEAAALAEAASIAATWHLTGR